MRCLCQIATMVCLTCSALAQPLGPVNDVDAEQAKVQCALSMLYDGMIAEDSAVLRAFIHVEGDSDGALRDAQADRILANNRLARALARLNLLHGENPFAEFHVFWFEDFAFAMLAGDWTIE